VGPDNLHVNNYIYQKCIMAVLDVMLCTLIKLLSALNGFLFTLQMKVLGSSERLLNSYNTMWHHIPEDNNMS